MMKKILSILCMLVLVVGLVTGCGNKEATTNDDNNNDSQVTENDNNNDNQTSNDTENDDNNSTTAENNKSLVLYFSATNTTEGVAKMIAEVTDGELVEIVPKEKYTSTDLNYNNDNCRANKEMNDESARPEIENKINIDGYDTIYIGYPIWWGTNPRIILTLLDSYNFDGKNVALFCTSGGSGILQSVSDIKKYNSKINIIDGKKFNSSVTKDEVKSWIDTIN